MMLAGGGALSANTIIAFNAESLVSFANIVSAETELRSG